MAEARVQRRLAAILSADVVGYSRLMGIDETGTLARLKAVRRDIIGPLIATHSGRTVKLVTERWSSSPARSTPSAARSRSKKGFANSMRAAPKTTPSSSGSASMSAISSSTATTSMATA